VFFLPEESFFSKKDETLLEKVGECVIYYAFMNEQFDAK